MTLEPRDPRLVEGLALLRRRAWFEAHEALEDVWRPMPQGPARDALQGAIQAAVALEHLRRGNRRGATTVWGRARERWRGLDHELAGLGLAGWAAAVARFFEPLPEPLPPSEVWPAP